MPIYQNSILDAPLEIEEIYQALKSFKALKLQDRIDFTLSSTKNIRVR